MKLIKQRSGSIYWVACLLLLGSLIASPGFAGQGHGGGKGGGPGGGTETSVMPVYRGSARALDVSVNALIVSTHIIQSDTGELDSSGGSKDETLLTLNLPVVQAELLKATTVGSGHQTDSMAQTLGVHLDLSALGVGLTIDASVLEAGAQSRCVNGVTQFSGYSDIAELNINGKPINVGKEPNTVIALDGLVKIFINEQYQDDYGITVRALRVEVLGVLGTPVAEVILSQARAGLDCGSGPDGECPAAADFVTGGGFFSASDGSRVVFGMNGGEFPSGDLKGHLNLVTSGHHIKGTPLTDYHIINDTTRELDFIADDSGLATMCVVRVSDEGEPGRNDTFGIACDSGYMASGVLSQGGNIQLHQPQACNSGGPSGGNTDKGNKGGGKNH